MLGKPFSPDLAVPRTIHASRPNWPAWRSSKRNMRPRPPGCVVPCASIPTTNTRTISSAPFISSKAILRRRSSIGTASGNLTSSQSRQIIHCAFIPPCSIARWPFRRLLSCVFLISKQLAYAWREWESFPIRACVSLLVRMASSMQCSSSRSAMAGETMCGKG